MLTYPDIDPIIFAIGPLKLRWYGMMYLLGFAAFWWLGSRRARREGSLWTPFQVQDFLFYGALGVILGGRIGYMLFYGFDALVENSLNLFRIWDGGMSFHGGLVGVLVAMAWYARRNGRTFFQLADFVAPLVPIGLGAGRIGNFINGELWGRPTDLPWGMVFPYVDGQPRHPSQLYEVLLEGVVLFAVLWWYSASARPRRAVSGLFLLLYGVFRFAVEFVRQPDVQLGFVAFGWITMGQVLSVPLIAFGAWLLWNAYRQHAADP